MSGPHLVPGDRDPSWTMAPAMRSTNWVHRTFRVAHGCARCSVSPDLPDVSLPFSCENVPPSHGRTLPETEHTMVNRLTPLRIAALLRPSRRRVRSQVRRRMRRFVLSAAMVVMALIGWRATQMVDVLLGDSTFPTPGVALQAMAHTLAPPMYTTPVARHGATPLRSGSRLLYATISTYQATPEQADEDHTVTASGLKVVPPPPYLVVANNSLPFGTKVKIRDRVYIVADRMNSRYGAHHFDILTQGENFKLRNEPVLILPRS